MKVDRQFERGRGGGEVGSELGVTTEQWRGAER